MQRDEIPASTDYRRLHCRFFCAEKNLVIEVDGPIHERKAQKKTDQHRRDVFNLRGIREMRFTNREVENNIEDVINRIKADNIGI